MQGNQEKEGISSPLRKGLDDSPVICLLVLVLPLYAARWELWQDLAEQWDRSMCQNGCARTWQAWVWECQQINLAKVPPSKPSHLSLVGNNMGLCSGFLPQSILSTELKSYKTCRWKKGHTFDIDGTALWALVELPVNSVSVLTSRAEGVNFWQIISVTCWGS